MPPEQVSRDQLYGEMLDLRGEFGKMTATQAQFGLQLTTLIAEFEKFRKEQFGQLQRAFIWFSVTGLVVVVLALIILLVLIANGRI